MISKLYRKYNYEKCIMKNEIITNEIMNKNTDPLTPEHFSHKTGSQIYFFPKGRMGQGHHNIIIQGIPSTQVWLRRQRVNDHRLAFEENK